MSMKLKFAETFGNQTTAKMKSSQKKAGKPGKATWDLPVSRKFYEGLLSRVDEVIRAVFFDPSPEYFRLARRMINCYLNDNLHAIPERDIIPEVRLIFLTLKAEIDQARERSLRARLVARRRAAVKKSENNKPVDRIPEVSEEKTQRESLTSGPEDKDRKYTIVNTCRSDGLLPDG